MKPKHNGGRVLPTDWNEVIGEVQELLTQAEREAGEREQVLAGIVPGVASPHKEATWKEGLERFEDRLRLFYSGVQQAEDDASEAELVLADREKALEHWLARTAEIARRVAKTQGNTAHSDKLMV